MESYCTLVKWVKPTFDKKAGVLYSASFALGFVDLGMLWLDHIYSGALGQSSVWLEGGADHHFHPSSVQ